MKEKILREFDKDKSKFNDFREKMEFLIIELIKNEQIPIHQITGRVKERTSLDKKIDKKDNKYGNVSEITDIIGIRIITYLESDVDKIAELLRREFDLDKENSIDKRKLKTDQFGYRSLHYVVSCKKERTNLVEYKRFKDLKFEIQIRSILQHAWAEIEHDLGYKGINSIPDAYKRSFNRVSALLESADLEFDRLKKELTKYESEVGILIENEPENVPIDQTSLLSLVESDKIINEAKNIILKNVGCDFIQNNDYSTQIDLFKNYFSINTINDLKKSLLQHKKLYLLFVNEFTKDLDYSSLPGTLMIFYFQHFLASLEENQKDVEEYIRLGNMGRENGHFIEVMKRAKTTANTGNRCTSP